VKTSKTDTKTNDKTRKPNNTSTNALVKTTIVLKENTWKGHGITFSHQVIVVGFFASLARLHPG